MGRFNKFKEQQKRSSYVVLFSKKVKGEKPFKIGAPKIKYLPSENKTDNENLL